jgi:sugar phosphate isomerase/epimerase
LTIPYHSLHTIYYNRFVTRRELVAGAAACAATLWARSHWDRTRISAITDEIGNTADEAVDFARENGLLFVEVRNQPGSDREYATGREADMDADATHLANEKVKVSVVDTSLLKFAWPGSPGGRAAPDQARWDRRMDDLHKAFRCAQIMGSDKVAIFAGARVADPSAMFPRIADTIAEMAVEAEKEKVALLVENDPATNVATCAELAALMKLTPSKWVGIDWTPAPGGHALLPKKRILNVHVPARSLTPGTPEWADWKAILRALDKDGYGGKIALATGVSGSPGIALARDALDQLVHIVREVS